MEDEKLGYKHTGWCDEDLMDPNSSKFWDYEIYCDWTGIIFITVNTVINTNICLFRALWVRHCAGHWKVFLHLPKRKWAQLPLLSRLWNRGSVWIRRYPPTLPHGKLESWHAFWGCAHFVKCCYLLFNRSGGKFLTLSLEKKKKKTFQDEEGGGIV